MFRNSHLSTYMNQYHNILRQYTEHFLFVKTYLETDLPWCRVYGSASKSKLKPPPGSATQLSRIYSSESICSRRASCVTNKTGGGVGKGRGRLEMMGRGLQVDSDDTSHALITWSHRTVSPCTELASQQGFSTIHTYIIKHVHRLSRA